MTAKEIYAAVAIALMLFSRGTYFTSILKGRTKPHAFSWLIWGVISSIGFAAQIAEHAGAASWVRGVGCITCFVVVGLCWFKGERDIRRADWITLAVSLAAIPLWMLTKTPMWSVILVCLIDTSGYLPTVRKVYAKPTQETPYGYLLSCGGAFLSVLAIDNYTISTWLYPTVLTASNLLMACYIFLRRYQLHVHARKNLPVASEEANLHFQ
ncbi:MAG TPA: hypothetical protein VEF76_11780 [Patescibacteria group bacterium]|nr:hypothetical protein [Patescibacteria group bacterium]